ncbi:potassium transporter TrkG [Deinococcus marmoris]|uniref:potassium transporter TrkG n=1 Tax=Deinococcus marmoris TaxID=249408 RepID=UPI0024804D87|nr:potassium transporter TrkG [Deinococcus marmoris]
MAFETLSALTAFSLSVNLTPHLSDSGKLVLVVLMFLGRVGFLSLLLAFRPAQPQDMRLPQERDFTVG